MGDFVPIIKYFNRVLLSFSILLNTILGGSTNQSFSARNWELKKAKKLNLVWLIDFIFFWQPNHCQDSYVKWQIINYAIDHYDSIGKN